MATTLTAPTVACTCGAEIVAEGKVVHFCAQRFGRKVVSREHVGFFDGQPICFRAFSATSAIEVEVELDAYAADLLRQTLIDTLDAEADAADELSDEEPLLVALVCEFAGCHEQAVHIPISPDGTQANVCCAHFLEMKGYSCLCFDPPADETPWEPCPGCAGEGWLPAGGWGDQGGGWVQTCPDCDGTKSNGKCRACGGVHFIQTCPTIRAQLFARALVVPDLLAEADTVLAQSRSFGFAA